MLDENSRKPGSLGQASGWGLRRRRAKNFQISSEGGGLLVAGWLLSDWSLTHAGYYGRGIAVGVLSITGPGSYLVFLSRSNTQNRAASKEAPLHAFLT